MTSAVVVVVALVVVDTSCIILWKLSAPRKRGFWNSIWKSYLVYNGEQLVIIGVCMMLSVSRRPLPRYYPSSGGTKSSI